VREQGVVLEQEPDPSLLGPEKHAPRPVEPRFVIEPNHALIRSVQPRETTESRGLATTRRSIQSGHPATAEFSVNHRAAHELLHEPGIEAVSHDLT
jgi:hypothetical protein